MTEALRSTGWSVTPSFTEHAPTSALTLLLDDTGLTQLAGEPPVAWQTPWVEMSDVELVRTRRVMRIGATVAGASESVVYRRDRGDACTERDGVRRDVQR